MRPIPVLATLLAAPTLLLSACQETAGGDDDTASAVDCSERGIDVPSPRGEVAGAWDAARGRFVIFGGDEGVPVECYPQTDFVGETWAFHTDCDNFERLQVSEAPQSRGRHAVALDAARGWMLIHGGRFRDGTSGAYTLLDDAWAFDFATDTWTLVATGGPAARSNHTAVVAGDRMIVYGGSTSTDGASFDPRSDVWALDLGSGAWTELEIQGEGPGERLFHAAAISDDGRTMYVYGGGDEGAFTGPFFGDLWALDLETLRWTELHDGGGEAPRARIWAALHHDGARDRLVLFGGHDDGSLGNTNEVWEFRLSEGVWNRLREGDVQTASANGFCDFPADFVDPDLKSPERRNAFASAITDRGELIVFGGKTDCGIINDVWTWSLERGGWSERSPATAGEICLRASASCSSMCF